MAVLSPTSGRIEDITDNKIFIYIPIEANHLIYSPIDGVINSISFERGLFANSRFVSEPYKTGKLHIFALDQKNREVFFSIEVGKPAYVTDTIDFYKEKNDQIKKGEIIGEIILGSRCSIEADREVFIVNPNLRKHSVVVGGSTILFFKRVEKSIKEVYDFDHIT